MSPNGKPFIAGNTSSPPKDEDRRGKQPLIDPDTANDEEHKFGNISSDESSNVNSTRRKLEIGGGSRTIARKKDASVCSECYEIFPTRRALYRHMRGHPEVNLHGMCPQSQLEAEEIEVAKTLMILAAKGGKDCGETAKATDGASVGETDGCLFSCSWCKKTFKSRSALRQHQKRRRNNILRYYVVGKEEGCSVKKEKEKEKDNSGDRLPFFLARYKCDICGRQFVNPQGLGSHKRTHPREEQHLGSTKKRNLMIDLNFPPPSEDEDEE